MVAVELVVPVGRDDECGHVHPACEQPQDVERRLVAPVQVLEQEHRRLLCELVAERSEHLRGLFAHPDCVGEGLTLDGNVEQRAERARGGQRVACTRKDANLVVDPAAERARERGLAGARLAAHEHDPSLPEACLVERLREHCERLVTLEKLLRAATRVERETHGLDDGP